jgi:hypothetical protein
MSLYKYVQNPISRKGKILPKKIDTESDPSNRSSFERSFGYGDMVLLTFFFQAAMGIGMEHSGI